MVRSSITQSEGVRSIDNIAPSAVPFYACLILQPTGNSITLTWTKSESDVGVLGVLTPFLSDQLMIW